MLFDETFFKTLLESVSDGVYIVDVNNTILFWNKGAETISGYTSAEVVGKNCIGDTLRHIDETGASLCQGSCPTRKAIATGLSNDAHLSLLHKGGYRIQVHTKIMPTRNNQGEIIGAVEVFSRELNTYDAIKMQYLAKMAYYDSVTELPNRQYAEIKLTAALKEMQETELPIGILLVKVLNLKAINESYGEAAGDQLLKVVAKTLANNLGYPNLIARWQGAKFLIMSYAGKRSLLLLLATKLQNLLSQSSLLLNELTIPVSISISGALSHTNDTSTELLIRAEKHLIQQGSPTYDTIILITE